uniref:Dehydration-responsive element-binding protein 1F n=1 Tax=Cajanus cajan TaxID=3821 RepID=A0A151QPC1_CAJCA|nr:Dehydration-responsive element-binding protein 1F [Cajanus cajan]
MNFEIESPFSFQSSSLICTPPKNPNLVSETSQFVSHKRKGGRKKFKETRHPIYRGVRQRKGKWVCELREPKKTSRIWLGTYPTPEMAARAHDVGALVIRGTSAILNFPNSLSFLPIVNSSSSHKDIRAAAAEAAESFRPITSFNQKIGRKTKLLESSLKSMHSLDREKCDAINSGTEKSIEDLSSTHVFFDEEAFFNMPSLLDRMAESLGVFPLPYQDYLDDYAYCMDFNLWTD